MSKLFSADTPEEYKEKVFEAIDEAKENGSATLETDGDLLQFADVDGDIIIEDQTDDINEVTRASENAEDPNDVILSAVEIPEEGEPSEEPTEAPTEETKVESNNLDDFKVDRIEGKNGKDAENLQSITITRIPGKDGDADDIVEDLEITVDEGINDESKSGTDTYSLKFKNYSLNRAKVFAKIFSEMASPIQKIVDEANVDENVEVKFKGDQLKVMSLKVGTPTRTFSEESEEEPTADVTKIIDLANELADVAENLNKDNAEEVKEKAESLIEECEECEKNECNTFSLKSFKSLAKMFAETATEVLDAEEVVEEPTEEPTEEVVEEVVTESNANPTVLQCEETGKWYIKEDPDMKLYDTQEEAEQVAAKSFSDPTVEVTIKDLEPSTIADLLKQPGELSGEPAKEDENPQAEPVVDPNEGAGRSFSFTGNKKPSINSLLFTEIN